MLHKQFLIATLLLGSLATTPAKAYSSCCASRYTSSWGTHTSINLYRCSPSTIRSQSEIERFVRNLYSHLGLIRHGRMQFLYNYAGNGYTSGWSGIQQANGHSDIAIRVDELNNDIYLDFFSCAAYDPYDVARRAQDFFLAYDMTYEVVRR